MKVEEVKGGEKVGKSVAEQRECLVEQVVKCEQGT